MALADADIIAAVNGASVNNAGIATQQQLQDCFSLLLAFQQVLAPVAAASNPPTTVAVLALGFAQGAALAIQMQSNLAAQATLQKSLVTQQQSGQTQLQSLQAAYQTMTAQLAGINTPAVG